MTGTQLNLWVNLGKIDIYMKLNFPVYEHSVSLHLLFSIKLYTFFPLKKNVHIVSLNPISSPGWAVKHEQAKEKDSNRVTKSQRL